MTAPNPTVAALVLLFVGYCAFVAGWLCGWSRGVKAPRPPVRLNVVLMRGESEPMEMDDGGGFDWQSIESPRPRT